MAFLQGKFVWFEHMSADVEKAGRFYTSLFGWTIEHHPVGDQRYSMLKNGAEGIGGLRSLPKVQPRPAQPPGSSPGWLGYMSVPDVDASVGTAQAAGARIIAPPFDIPNTGRAATLADPTGGVFAVWKGAQGDMAEQDPPPAGSWYWNELWTGDARKALEFYTKVFGYGYDTMDMGAQGTYYVFTKDGKARAGMMQSNTPGAQTLWLPYVLVPRCDATLAKAKQLGAEEVMPATDVAGVGRFAIVIDPTQATIAFLNTPQ